MKKRIVIIISVLSLLFVIIIVNMISPYLFKPKPIIRREILRNTSIGMSIDDVVRVLRRENKWRDVRRESNTVHSHTYHFPPYIGVYWEFDEDEKLININIRKYWTP